MSRARPAKSGIAKTFIAHSLELRASPAWRALPDNARRVLDRLEWNTCSMPGIATAP